MDTDWVYFLINLGLSEPIIKIGFTGYFKRRMSFYQGWYLMGVQEGDLKREQYLHSLFRPYLVRGDEYYRPSEELLQYIYYNTHQSIPDEWLGQMKRFDMSVFDSVVDEAVWRAAPAANASPREQEA